MEPQISIIVPIYNAASTLLRCIHALMVQTYSNIEIILVNDGSSDNSLQICHQFAAEDNRIRVIDKSNGGVSSARNAGLDAATGSYIMFCDSDDWAEPDWCEELISHYEENCLVMCGYFIEGKHYPPNEIRSSVSCDRYAREDFFRLKSNGFNAPWNKIYSSKVINAYNIRFNCLLTNGEDYLFNLQYLTHISGGILFLNRCVFHYQWPRGNSLSVKVPNNYFEQCCYLIKAVLSHAEKLGLCNPYGKQQIYTDSFYEFQKILISIIQRTDMTSKNKINELTYIMSNDIYQQCAAEASISSNPIYGYLSRRKNGFGLWLWHQLTKILRKSDQ